jgi:Phage-related protein
MATPILNLSVEPGFEKEVSLAEISTQLGDSYEQTMKLGLNPENVIYKIKSIALTESQYQSIESQLRTFRGITNFLWSADPDNIPREGFYCDSWEWTREGVNAWVLNAEFKRDFQSPCEAFSEFLDPNLFLTQLEESIWWLDRYTRDTKPLIINSDGVSVNAFHDVVGRGGYFPPSSGTSEGQAILIRALLLARKCPISVAAKAKCLDLALLLAEALITYFYLEPIPTNPTAQIWLPHG